MLVFWVIFSLILFSIIATYGCPGSKHYVLTQQNPKAGRKRKAFFVKLSPPPLPPPSRDGKSFLQPSADFPICPISIVSPESVADKRKWGSRYHLNTMSVHPLEVDEGPTHLSLLVFCIWSYQCFVIMETGRPMGRRSVVYARYSDIVVIFSISHIRNIPIQILF